MPPRDIFKRKDTIKAYKNRQSYLKKTVIERLKGLKIKGGNQND